jgi:Kef-type K+ transport system membrane component KefB
MVLSAHRSVALWSALLLLPSTVGALAGGSGAAPSEVIFLAELIVLMLAGRLLGEAMQRLGQPSIMGQLLAGILLGPSVLGWVWPDLQHWLFPDNKQQKAMIDAISQLGILLLLLLTGMETDFKLMRQFSRAAISISLVGVAVPFACGASLGAWTPESLLPGADKRLLTALFLGTALSISSIKIVALFLLASFTIGRRIVFHIIRWANDNFESEFAVITTILVIMGAATISAPPPTGWAAASTRSGP